MKSALRVVDNAAIVLNASEGIEVGTELAWEYSTDPGYLVLWSGSQNIFGISDWERRHWLPNIVRPVRLVSDYWFVLVNRVWRDRSLVEKHPMSGLKKI